MSRSEIAKRHHANYYRVCSIGHSRMLQVSIHRHLHALHCKGHITRKCIIHVASRFLFVSYCLPNNVSIQRLLLCASVSLLHIHLARGLQEHACVISPGNKVLMMFTESTVIHCGERAMHAVVQYLIILPVDGSKISSLSPSASSASQISSLSVVSCHFQKNMSIKSFRVSYNLYLETNSLMKNK
jgi:hypothetical protein